MSSQRGNRRCPECLRFPDTDFRHWKACVPKRRWPEWVRAGFATQEEWAAATGGMPNVAGGASIDVMDRPYEAPIAAFEATCGECGKVCASAAGLAAHQRKHAREAVTA